jgi:hypothetical protein
MAADDELMSAAITIQNAWRTKVARKEVAKRALEGKVGKITKVDPKVAEHMKKQKELEAQRDAAVAAGDHHWVESYDPEHEAHYYYCSITHETVWEKPDSYVMAADDELMSAAITIQNAWRTKLAKQEVAKRALKGGKKGLGSAHSNKVAEHMKKQKELEAQRNAAVAAGDHHWVESYDPEHEAYYYYCTYTQEMQWEKPDSYVMAADDELMCAAITIQNAWRSKVARGEVKKKKEDTGKFNKCLINAS